MYAVVYAESDFGKFSGMVPERFRNPIWWIFRNGFGMVPEAFHVSCEDIFAENPIPSVLSAKIGVALSVVLSSDFGGGGHLSAWKHMLAFCKTYSWSFRKIYV